MRSTVLKSDRKDRARYPGLNIIIRWDVSVHIHLSILLNSLYYEWELLFAFVIE